MSQAKFKIPFNNYIANGDTTLAAISAMLDEKIAAHAPGGSKRVANPIRDSATGKLIAVEIELPEAAAQQAVASLANNGGVAGEPVVIPAPLLILDFDATEGITYSGDTATWDGAASNGDRLVGMIHGQALPFPGFPFSPQDKFSFYKGGVIDSEAVASAGQAYFRILNETVFSPKGTGDKVMRVKDGEVTIKYGGGTVLPLKVNATELAVTEPATSGNLDTYFIDTVGRLWLQDRRIEGSSLPGFPIVEFDDAVIAQNGIAS